VRISLVKVLLTVKRLRRTASNTRILIILHQKNKASQLPSNTMMTLARLTSIICSTKTWIVNRLIRLNSNLILSLRMMNTITSPLHNSLTRSFLRLDYREEELLVDKGLDRVVRV